MLSCAVLVLVAACVSNPRDDLVAFIRQKVHVQGGFAAVYKSAKTDNRIYLSFDTPSGSFIYIFNADVYARASDGTPLEGRARKGGVKVRDLPVDRNICGIAENWASPSLILLQLVSMPDEMLDVTKTDDGGFRFRTHFPMANRAYATGLAPEGFTAEPVDETYTLSAQGLVTRIERPTMKMTHIPDYDPKSMNSLPVSRIMNEGAWVLEHLETWTGSPPHPFTIASIEERAVRNPTAGGRVVTMIPPSSPEAAAADVGSLVHDDPVNNYRWPLVIAGLLITTIGVVAYVRARR